MCREHYVSGILKQKKHVLTGRNGSQLLLELTLLWVLLAEVRTGYAWTCWEPAPSISAPRHLGVLLSCRLFVGWIIDIVYRSLPIMLLRLSLCTWDLDSRIKTGISSNSPSCYSKRLWKWKVFINIISLSILQIPRPSMGVTEMIASWFLNHGIWHIFWMQ